MRTAADHGDLRVRDSENDGSEHELREVLEQVLSGEAGRGRRGRLLHIRRSPSCYHSSFELQDVDVTFEDGSVLRLVVKFGGAGGLMRPQQAEPVKPAFLIDPAREPQVYRAILGPLAIDAPRCFGASIDPAGGRSALVLERLDDARPLWQVGEFETWQAAARWAAVMHRTCRGRQAELARAAPLLRYDEAFYERWMTRAVRFLEEARPSPPPWQLDRFRRLAGRYDRAVRRLVALPVTFVHGEYQPSNILVQDAPGGPRIRPVDWELAAVAPAPMDLADLAAGKWTPEQRAELARAYCDAAGGGSAPDLRELLAELALCRLHRAVQWLGWAAHWSPPNEHRQDWLGVALQAEEELGL